MDKITLSDILSGFSQSKINDNFARITDAINNKVLGNNGDVLQGDLDVNGKRLLNAQYILTSPNGTKYKLTVSNAGVVSATVVT